MSGAAIARASTDRTLPAEFVGKIEPNYYCRAWNAKRVKYCRTRAGAGTAHPGVGRCSRHGGERKDGDARVKHGGRSELRNDRIRELIEQHAADPELLDVSRTLATAKALMDDYIERYYEITPALLAWYAASEPLSDEHRHAVVHCLNALEVELSGAYGDLSTRQTLEQLAVAREAVAHLSSPRAEKPHHVPDISEAVRHADIISKIIHRVNQHQSQSAVSYARLATFMFELARELDALIPDRELLQTINERIQRVRI